MKKSKTQKTDPLLALAGTLKWDDIGKPDTVSPPETGISPFDDSLTVEMVDAEVKSALKDFDEPKL